MTAVSRLKRPVQYGARLLEVVFRYRQHARVVWEAGQPLIEVRRSAGRLLVHPLDYGVAWPLYTGLGFGELEQAFLEQTVKKGMRIVDVGANVGLFTIQLAKLVGHEGRVLAIEPEPRNVRLLRANIQRNGADSVTVCDCGAGAQRGEARLMRSDVNYGDHRIGPTDALHTEEVRIKLETVDGLVGDHKFDRVDLVKMDVQGFEAMVLEGMQHTLRHSRPIVLTEFWPHRMERVKRGSSEAFLSTFLDMGYQASLLGGNGSRMSTIRAVNALLPSDVAEEERQIDVIFWPQGAQ